ncbi:uncharacterized protein LOC141691228 [Apium graveolens]|uniref:uncharacterized protein LOC141691228 n=1 Tax=Apium graveolens TaxID=4045 RepID=UPI003D79790F
MRFNAGNTDLENKTIANFRKWRLVVGDGKKTNISPSPDSGEMLIKIPNQYIVHTSEDPIQKLFEVTYPDFMHNISSYEYLRSRAILTPTNIVVDEINTTILKKIPGMVYTYLSQDSIDDAGDDDNDFRSAFPVEYLNSINMSCIPKHELKLKVGVVVMLMRNLNQIMGLCNGSTTVRTADDDGIIPSQKFELLDLGDLFAKANKCLPQQQPEFAIYIIGVMEEYEGLNKLSTRYGDGHCEV